MGKTFVYNTGNFTAPAGEIWKEYGLFFDGTLNNKNNTDLRIKKEKGTATAAELKAYKAGSKRDIIDEQGVDNSYSNDYTNVARLWQNCEKKSYAIYVEGIGTKYKKLDDGDGFMFGAGSAGIRMKVRKACEDLAKRLGTLKNTLSSETKITKITLDVFGFSRGAAAARNFVHEVNTKEAYTPKGYFQNIRKQNIDKEQEDKERMRKKFESSGGEIPIQDGSQSLPKPLTYSVQMRDSDGIIIEMDELTEGNLPKMGHLGRALFQNGFTFDDIELIEINIRFIGVYDTVASYYKEASMPKFVYDQQSGKDPSINKYFANDVMELELNTLGSFTQAVHFTAGDEHRYNFALSEFTGAEEKEFPGVHCDIGGAYNNEVETVDEIEVAFDPSFNITKLAEQKAIHYLKKGFWGFDAEVKLNNFKKWLIENQWFKEADLEISDKNIVMYKGKKIVLPSTFFLPILKMVYLNGLYYKITGRRDVKKEYSYIPLLFMTEKFENALGTPFSKIVTDYDYFKTLFSIEGNNVLKTAEIRLRDYVFHNGEKWLYLTKSIEKIVDNMEKKDEDTKNSKHQFEKKEVDKVSISKPKDHRLPNKENPFETEPNQDKEGIDHIELDQNGEKVAVITEVKLKGEKRTENSLLGVLRHQYLHWSANKDWFGMNPTEKRRRVKI